MNRFKVLFEDKSSLYAFLSKKQIRLFSALLLHFQLRIHFMDKTGKSYIEN